MSWHESFTQFAADTKAHTKASFVNGVFTQALENDIYNKTAITTLETKIGSIESNISDAYDATSTYAVGDLCIHDNKLYECNTAIATAEIWTAAHWTETTINSLIAAQTQQINVLNTKVNWKNMNYKSEADVPSTYGNTTSSVFIYSNAQTTFAGYSNCIVRTYVYNLYNAIQIVSAVGTSPVKYRIANGYDTWGDWQQVVTSAILNNALAINNLTQL